MINETLYNEVTISKTLKRFKSVSKTHFYLMIFFGSLWSDIIIQRLHFIILKIPILKLFDESYQSIIYTFLFISSRKLIFCRLSKNDYILVISLVFVWWFSPVIYPDSLDFVQNNGLKFTFSVAPMVLFGAAIDYKDMKPVLVNFSRFTIAFSSFYYLFYYQSLASFEEKDEYMVAAYQILPHVLLIIFVYFENHLFYDLLLMAIGFILVMSFGTRGPLICVMFFISIYFFLLRESKDQLIKKNILIILGLFLFFNLDTICEFMKTFSKSIGMSSRIWDLILDSGEFISYSESSGRDQIQGSIMSYLINGDYLLGYGLGQDRTVTYAYSHNLIVELLFSFGFVFGGLMILSIVWVIVKVLLKHRDYDSKCFVLVLTSSYLLHLFFSGSFTTSTEFFFLLGFVIAENRRNRLSFKI